MTGPQLRIIRECAGLSQLALGKKLGISQTWVSRFERGLSPIPESVAERVALALPKATLEAQKVKAEEIEARERWQKKTNAYLNRRGRPRKEKGTVNESLPVAPPAEVRMCSTVELGPETLKALKDMIETAIRELAKVKVEAPVAIRPEVLNAKRDGDRYRAQATELMGRGW